MDRPPTLPRPPLEVEAQWRRLLDELYENLRPRPMGIRRVVAAPGGGEHEEELDLTYQTDSHLVLPLARALDAAIRHDSALWAGYDGLVAGRPGERGTNWLHPAGGPVTFATLSWPGWISLTIRAREGT